MLPGFFVGTYLKINLSAPGGVTRVAGFSIDLFLIRCIMSRREMLTYCVYAPLPRRPMPCQEP